MPDEGMERAVVARTYRRISAQLDIEAAALRAQSESFADAASRIEEGEYIDTLQLPSEPGSARETSPEELWRERRERILRAVVVASRRPAHELEEAGLERITEEAGEDAQDADDVKAMLDGLIREGFVESHRCRVKDWAQPMVVFVPTREGFEEAGHAPPPRGLPDKPESRSVYDVVEQPTREMAAVSRDEAAEAGDR